MENAFSKILTIHHIKKNFMKTIYNLHKVTLYTKSLQYHVGHLEKFFEVYNILSHNNFHQKKIGIYFLYIRRPII